MNIQTRHLNLTLDDIKKIRDRLEDRLETDWREMTTDDSFDRAYRNGKKHWNEFLTYCLDKQLTIKAACDTYNFRATEFGVRNFLEGEEDDLVDYWII